jgi:ligand-binding sensor domain-containing protein/DNA-binding CsgD family transcriptional regulator
MREFWLLLITGFVCHVMLQANPVEFGISDIEYFNRRQYGGATQNWNISQADNGLMYFANNDGIIEYDGSSWRLLPAPERFDNNTTRSVLAADEKIYVGATDEFGFYQPDSSGNFNYHSLSNQYDIGELGDFWNIFRIKDQIVFQSHNALCIYSPNEGVEVIQAISRISEAFLVNGMILISDDSMGLMELRQGTLYKIGGGEVFADHIISAIIAISPNQLVIGTMDAGLYKWDTSGIRKWNVPASPFLKEANVFCGTISGNDLVFGTIQSGVVVVTEQGNIKMIATKDKGLYNNTVLDIFIDKQKNIWAGLDNGIARIGYNSAVSFIQGYYDIGTGYSMKQVDDHFYLGTNQALYTISKEAFSNPTKSRDDFRMVKGTNGQVWSMFKDDLSGDFLIGHNLGIYRVDGERATLISPPSVNGAWEFIKAPGNENLLLVGTYAGMVLLKRNQENQWAFLRRIDGFTDSARFLEWDEKGRLWVAHGLKGLFRLEFDETYSRVTEINRNKDFGHIPDNFRGFSLSRIDNKIVFSSSHGIFSVNEEDQLVHDSLEYFFSDEAQYPVKMNQDRFGNIWFFIDNGVGVLRFQEDGTYKKIDNPMVPLKNKLVNGFESVYVLNEEIAFFGIEDGFGQYAVTNDVNYYQPFHVHIRDFRCQNREEERFFAASESPEQEYIPEYAFGENNFEVFYSATWFSNGQMEYATMLEGFDTHRTSWGLKQSRQFTRLTEGEYVFKVSARNVHGVQSKPAKFRFVVLPPWYRTTTANIIYGILSILLIVIILGVTQRIAEKTRQREKLRQREKYKEREDELRQEALENEKEMIRLRNEKLRNDMKHKEKELANSTMHIIRKNDFLIKIKEELMKARKQNDQKTIDKRIALVVRQIDRDIDTEAHWKIFETHLEQVHEDFLKHMTNQHNDLTAREMRLAAYLRMDMSSKEIASLMNITPRAIENNRYKLRKKIGLGQGDNLVDYIMKI